MDTTNSVQFKFPLGAPILLGYDTVLEDGYSTYNFGRCDHSECRVFVKQKSGIISAKESTAESALFRKRFTISGLEDATIYIPRNILCRKIKGLRCRDAVKSTPKQTPIYDENFKVVKDDNYGTYFVAEHVTGSRALLMPFRKEIQ